METQVEVKSYIADRIHHIEKEAGRQRKEMICSLGKDFWKNDTCIASLRSARATRGLNIDDLGVASFHGTSTKANDKNESSVIQQQLKHLGRKYFLLYLVSSRNTLLATLKVLRLLG